MSLDFTKPNKVDIRQRLEAAVHSVWAEMATPIFGTNHQSCVFVCWAFVCLTQKYHPFSIVHLGTDTPDRRWSRLTYFAHEQAERILGRRGDISSYQSRAIYSGHPLDNKYGGAIRCDYPTDVIFSCSGMSEQTDETLCLLVADQLGMISFERREAIKSISAPFSE